jgi:hypothetical protein
MRRITTDLATTAALVEHGFAHVPPGQLRVHRSLHPAFAALEREFRGLPLDDYASGQRSRRVGYFIYLPRTDEIVPVPGSVYTQDAVFGSEDGGMVRQLAPLRKGTYGNPYLHELIAFAHGQLPETAGFGDACMVGVHALRLDAFAGAPAHSSPRRLHKDGERFFALNLVSRQNVTGGESVITANDGRLLLRHALTEPGELLILDDSKVWHHVEDLVVDVGQRRGHRGVLLTDFTPIRRVIALPDAQRAPAPWVDVPID